MNKRLILIILAIFTVTCGASSVQDSAPDSSGMDLEVGSITGSPTLPKSSLTFVANSIQHKNFQDTSEYCEPYTKKSSHVDIRTQVCTATPDEFMLGILKMEFHELSATIDSKKLGEGVLVNAAEIFKSENGVPEHTRITAEGNNFSGSLTNLTKTIYANTLSITLSYFGLKIPTVETNPVEAAKFDKKLHGFRMIVCSSPSNYSGTVRMQTLCYNRYAELGDVLVDFGKGFMFLNAEMTGEEYRPENYAFNIKRFLLKNESDHIRPEDSSSGKGSVVQGFYNPVISLGKGNEFKESYNITLAHNISNTFHFYDGLSFLKTDGVYCIDEVIEGTCPGGSSDPLTVGVFNAAVDSLVPVFPDTRAIPSE